MKHIFSALILSSFFLTGCGGGKGDAKPSSSNVVNFKTMDALMYAYDNQKVICNDEKDCSGAAAKITMIVEYKKSYTLAVCSGTLYNNKYIITNSHCVPDSLKRSGSDCSERMKVLFPKTSQYRAENVKCLRVIQAYDQEAGQPDLAVLELETSISRGLSPKIVPGAFVENNNAHAYTMNPVSAQLGVIERKNCKISTNNIMIVNKNVNAPRAGIYGYSCNVIGGNSGSGLFDDNEQLIGAVSHRIEVSEATKVLRESGFNVTANAYAGFAQNIGCINSILKNDGAACTTERTLQDSDWRELINNSLEESNVKGISLSQLEYEIVDGFKIKFKESKNPDPLKSFVFLEKLLLETSEKESSGHLVNWSEHLSH